MWNNSRTAVSAVPRHRRGQPENADLLPVMRAVKEWAEVYVDDVLAARAGH
jgi:DNA-binding HxlR family transcriptional regulator